MHCGGQVHARRWLRLPEDTNCPPYLELRQQALIALRWFVFAQPLLEVASVH